MTVPISARIVRVPTDDASLRLELEVNGRRGISATASIDMIDDLGRAVVEEELRKALSDALAALWPGAKLEPAS
jgi:hypothetical protein